MDKRQYLQELDAIRGIAISMVLVYHYFPSSLICQFGWSGVDLFFVLSGFLLSKRLLPYIENKKNILIYFRNRFLRIVPLYFAFLTIFFLSWFYFLSQKNVASTKFYSQHYLLFYTFLQNWLFIFTESSLSTNLHHLWSIGVEEQVYFLLPLIFLFFRKSKSLVFASVVLILLILLSRCFYYDIELIKKDFTKVFWNTFFRLDSFLIGVLLYHFLSGIEYSKFLTKLNIVFIISTIILLFGIFYYKSANNTSIFFSTIGYTLLAIFYACIIYFAIYKKYKILNFLCNSKMLKYLGKISYGLYIYHWPILLLCLGLSSKLSTWLNTFGIVVNATPICILLSFFITILLSHISFYYFESYFLKMKKSYIV